MKKFLLSLATAFSFVLFLGSCTNEEDINNNGYSDKEKAKIETLMNLFDSYGWELDTTVSIEQRNKELLEMDYEKTKSFLEYMSNGIEFDNFEPTQQNEDNAPKGVSRNFVGIIFYTRKVLLTSHYEKRLFEHASQPRVAGSDIRLLSYLWS